MNEERIKSYFLGKLPPDDAERFEEDFADSAELTEQAQVVEGELVDDYLRGNLATPEKVLFETNYLTTEARRENLRLADELWKIAGKKELTAEIIAAPQKSFWQNWNALRVAFAGFAALLLLGAFAFFWLNSRGKDEIVKQTNTNQTPSPNTENRTIQPLENVNIADQNANLAPDSNTPKNKTTSPTPAIKTTPTPKPIEQSASSFASFTLLPGLLRGGGEQSIKISPNTTKINLRLNLPPDANKYQTYNATIKTADGETVSTFSNLKSLNLNLPAGKLTKQTYIIFLEGKNAQNPAESIAEYTFRVRR